MHSKKDLYADEELVFKSPFGPRGQQQQHQRRLEEVHVQKFCSFRIPKMLISIHFYYLGRTALQSNKKKTTTVKNIYPAGLLAFINFVTKDGVFFSLSLSHFWVNEVE